MKSAVYQDGGEREVINKLELVFEAHTNKMILQAATNAVAAEKAPSGKNSFASSLTRFIERMEYLDESCSQRRHFIWI